MLILLLLIAFLAISISLGYNLWKQRNELTQYLNEIAPLFHQRRNLVQQLTHCLENVSTNNDHQQTSRWLKQLCWHSKTRHLSLQEKVAVENGILAASYDALAAIEKQCLLPLPSSFSTLKTDLYEINLMLNQAYPTYNTKAQAYNYALQKFPTQIVAKLWRLRPHLLFDTITIEEQVAIKTLVAVDV